MSYPPHKTLASVPVTQEIALKFLTTYLAATKTTPYLLPNARLEPSGPAAGSSSSNIQINNLQRVEAGLKGEWLAPVLDLQGEGNEMDVAAGLGTGGEGDNMDVEGWQDLDEYQREQSVEEGEVGPRAVGVAQEGDSDFEGRMEIEVEEAPEEELPKARKIKTKHEGGVNGKSETVFEKKSKKQAKKDRLKEDKKRKHEERLKNKDAEE